MNNIGVESAVVNNRYIDVFWNHRFTNHVGNQLSLSPIFLAMFFAIGLRVVASTRNRNSHTALGNNYPHNEHVLLRIATS